MWEDNRNYQHRTEVATKVNDHRIWWLHLSNAARLNIYKGAIWLANNIFKTTYKVITQGFNGWTKLTFVCRIHSFGYIKLASYFFYKQFDHLPIDMRHSDS